MSQPTSGVPAELPGVVLALTLLLSNLITVALSGMPEFAWRLVVPQSVIIMATVTVAWVVGRRIRRWWVPLLGLIAPIITIAGVLATASDGDHRGYLLALPAAAGGILVVIIVYWCLGILGARGARHGRGRGWTWTAFGLLAAGIPIWTTLLLTLAVSDTILEKAMTVRTLVSIIVTGLLFVVGAGLAAAGHRAPVIVGSLLLLGFALSAVPDLVNGAEVWSTGLKLLGGLAAAGCAGLRARSLGSGSAQNATVLAGNSVDEGPPAPLPQDELTKDIH